MSLITQIEYWVVASLRNMRRFFFIHLIAILTVSLVVLAWGLGRWGQRLLEALVLSSENQISMVVYLSQDAKKDALDRLRQKFQFEAPVQIRFVSKDEALKRLEKELAEGGIHLGALRENPLQASFELILPAGSRNPQTLEALARQWRSLPEVTAVDHRSDVSSKLQNISRLLRRVGLGALGAIAVVGLWMIFATLQLAILSRREEIEIQKWVGATETFVRFPFILEGALQGLIGASIAWGTVYVLRHLGMKVFHASFSFLLPSTGWPDFSLELLLEMMGGGLLLGIFGSLLAVGRFVRA